MSFSEEILSEEILSEEILSEDIQAFINNNLKADISSLLLKGIHFKGVSAKEVISQIEAKKRSEKKLPTWFNAEIIYYPNKLNIEQTSSEATAKHKSGLVSGQSLIDLTGGFGVDAFYFSKQVENVTHCEINTALSEIVKHNYKVLNANNIECLKESGIDALKRIDKPFDWIFIDPSRRDDAQKKVFLLSDCAPNVKTFQNLFLKYANNVMIKTSPLLDLKATLSDLKHVKEIYSVALNNEVKELLWILERDFNEEPIIKTVNIQKEQHQEFQFQLSHESSNTADYAMPNNYLYEPNVSILKVGAFNAVSTILDIPKLHQHSHLYTSEILIDFPGRRFKIDKVVTFNKKSFAKEGISKANVTTRNFPLSVGDIRKKLKIKDGGSTYLFFTTNLKDEKNIIVCSKI